MMPIELEYLPEDEIVIMKMVGFLTANEITETIRKEVGERVENHPEMTLHAIYDVTDFEWTFQEFISYVKSRPPAASQPQSQGTVLEHFVGTSKWVQQLRTWWKKNLGKETTAFITMDDAIKYIQALQRSA